MSFFWLGSCALLVANAFAPEAIKLSAMGRGEAKKELPYFFALIPKDLNSNYVKRKLIKLPGVQKINQVSEDKVNGHVKSILAESKVALDDSLMALNFSGLKIYLAASLKESSQKLIRNYVSRLAGESEVTLGALHRPQDDPQKSEMFLSKHFSIGLSLLAGTVFFICMLSFWKKLERASFVYEQFQRRTRVFEKSLTYAHLPLLCALMAGFFVNQTTALIGLGLVCLSLMTSFTLGTQFKTH